MLSIAKFTYDWCLILTASFLLLSCSKVPYSKPDALYTLNAVASHPEGIVFFNNNRPREAVVFYKKSLRPLYQANLFSKLFLDIRQCSEYYEITVCKWYTSITLDHAEAQHYGDTLFNDYWTTEDADGEFYKGSVDGHQRFERLLNSKQPEIKFSFAVTDGSRQNTGRILSNWHVQKNNYVEIRTNKVEIFRKPSAISRLIPHIDMR